MQDAQNAKAADEKEKDALKAQIRALKEQLALASVEKTPEVAKEPTPEKAEVTAEDDLFFGEPAEPVVKPQREKKNRHDHAHVNPYKQQFMQKQKEQKGYTQQRQYSLFDENE